MHFDALAEDARSGADPHASDYLRRIRLTRVRSRTAGRKKCLSPASECRLCGTRRGLERHHLVPKSQGGDDMDENLVPLCGPFENECHRRITENDPEALALLRGRLRPEEEAYCALRMGWGWLERRYPSGA